MITLGLSQRETDRVLEALGLKNGKKKAAGAGDFADGNGGGENPRRILRRALYVALAGLVAAGVGWAGKAAGSALLSAAHAEVSVHRVVSAHARVIDDHTRQLGEHEAALRELRGQALPVPLAVRLIKLLEADAKARERKAVTP